MYTITINNEKPIKCKDYCIPSPEGKKTLYMSFNDKEDVGIKLAEIHDLSIVSNKKEMN